jgi:hypothetical protein
MLHPLPAAAGPISRPRHTDSGGVYPADATHGSRFQLRSGSPGNPLFKFRNSDFIEISIS